MITAKRDTKDYVKFLYMIEINEKTNIKHKISVI
jgi:hypothetical protein